MTGAAAAAAVAAAEGSNKLFLGDPDILSRNNKKVYIFSSWLLLALCAEPHEMLFKTGILKDINSSSVVGR